jgi:hypothetical protein
MQRAAKPLLTNSRFIKPRRRIALPNKLRSLAPSLRQCVEHFKGALTA